MKERGISLIALIITIIVIIILAAISIAGVTGIVERSRYAKFCGDLDAVQDAVSQAYGTKRIQEAQDPNGLKSSEEIYKWVATGEDGATPKTAKGPDRQNLYQLENKNNNLGLDLPKYGDSKWCVDPNTGEVYLMPGFEYEDKIYSSKSDVQAGGQEKQKPPTGVYAKLYTDGTLIFSSFDYTDETKGVTKNYGDIANTDNPWWNGSNNNCPGTTIIIYDEIRPNYTDCWFKNFTGETLDLKNLDTRCVTDMSSMFYGCSNLQTLDVSGFDTKNVTNMNSMFYGCSNLQTLDVSGFDTKNITNMDSMFRNCSSLRTLDVSGFDTRNVLYLPSMFSGCTALAEINGLKKFDVKDTTDLSGMFNNCINLETLDLSTWEIKLFNSITFYNSSSLTVYVKDDTIRDKLKLKESFSEINFVVGEPEEENPSK